MANIADVDTVKLLLGITDTSKDDAIEAWLPIVTDDVKEYCNNDFLASGVESYPVALKGYFAMMVGYRLNTSATQGFDSEREGGYSYTKSKGGNGESAGSYPSDLLTGLDKWRYLKTASGSTHWRPRDKRGSWYGV